MTPDIRAQLIDPDPVDWPTVLANWSWLLPPNFRVLAVSCFADVFVVPDGAIHMLDAGAGTFVKVAENEDDFITKANDVAYAKDWFMGPLVAQMQSAGIELNDGQCYGWKLPPVLGGQYIVENCFAIALTDYLPAYGSILAQLQDVPDGAQVVIKKSDR